MEGISAGTGRSMKPDAFEAGAEAAFGAKKEIDRTPDLIILFADRKYNHTELIAGVETVFDTIPMIGGTTAGELSTEGFSTGSVVIMAVASDDISFTTGIGHHMDKDEKQCGIDLVEAIRSKEAFDNGLTLAILPCGMAGDGVAVIEGITSALKNPLEVVGGFLGDGEQFENTYQFYNGKVYETSITGVLISSKGNFSTGTGVRSGFKSIGNRMFCTETEGNVIKKIDSVRALDLYKELLGEKRSERLPMVCLEYPFGLIDDTESVSGKDSFQLRSGLKVDHEAGTITCAGSVPEGSFITITTGSRGDLIQGAAQAAEQAKSGLGEKKPELVMVFSCIGRRLVLGRRVEEEIQTVQRVFGDEVPLIGFYTYGEIGPVKYQGRPQAEIKFHNETLVIWALGS